MSLSAAIGLFAQGFAAHAAADSGFASFIASLWPEAQKAGISRATFDTRDAWS
jgi:membrane-bound lytic murein transglycosylase B